MKALENTFNKLLHHKHLNTATADDHEVIVQDAITP